MNETKKYEHNKRIIPTIHPHRPMILVPKIVKEYKIGKIKMYLCEGDRKFVASIYDQWFKVTKTQIKPLRHKGNNPGQSKQMKGVDFQIKREKR